MKCAFATCVLMLAGILVGVPGVGVPEVDVADAGLDDCVVLFSPFCRFRFRAWHTGPCRVSDDMACTPVPLEGESRDDLQVSRLESRRCSGAHPGSDGDGRSARERRLLHGESAPLVISQSETLAAELAFEDSILFGQVYAKKAPGRTSLSVRGKGASPYPVATLTP